MLPSSIKLSDFIQNYRLQPEKWREAVFEICDKHNISTNLFSPFTDGSNLIASIEDRYIVKIFPPFHRHQWDSEYKTLQHLAGKVSVSIPELIAFGECDDIWTYVIISKLPGITLENVWKECNGVEKINLLNRIGKIMSEVHSLPVGNLITLEPQWNYFLEKQLTTYKARHLKNRMPDWFMLHIEDFVNESISIVPQHPDLVIMTCEYTPFNLLVTKHAGKYEISGMIDFGDAMIGYHEYDLLGPLLFLAAGNSDLVKSLLLGYGYADEQINQQLRRRVMILQVLHRFSNFKSQLRIPGWEDRVKSIAELEELIFALSVSN